MPSKQNVVYGLGLVARLHNLKIDNYNKKQRLVGYVLYGKDFNFLLITSKKVFEFIIVKDAKMGNILVTKCTLKV